MPSAAPPVSSTATTEGTGANEYFRSLVARPELVCAYSMRHPAEIDRWSRPKGGGGDGAQPVYDPVMDAVKIVVDAGDSTGDFKYRLPIPFSETDATAVLVWDMWFDESWTGDEEATGNFTTIKLLQIGSTGRRARRWFEFRNRLNGIEDEAVMRTRAKVYLDGTADEARGPNVREASPLQPYAPDVLSQDGEGFVIRARTWTRTWFQVVRRPAPAYDLVSVWMADEMRDAVMIWDNLELNVPGALDRFWVQFNASQRRTGPTLTAYLRNLALLRYPAGGMPPLVRPVP